MCVCYHVADCKCYTYVYIMYVEVICMYLFLCIDNELHEIYEYCYFYSIFSHMMLFFVLPFLIKRAKEKLQITISTIDIKDFHWTL
jgi:hypothetical protein